MNSTDPHFRLGQRLGAAQHGADADELDRRIGHASVMNSADAAPFNRELCKIAAAAYQADDSPNAPAAILFRNLASAPEWDAGYDRFSDCVKRALSKSAMLMLQTGSQV